MMNDAAPLGADHPERMSLIDIHHSSIFLGSLHHGRQVGNVPGHTEDAIHDDEATRFFRDSLETVAEGIHRVVTVGNQFGGSNLASLDDRGMVLTIAQNEVIGLGQSGKSPLVGKESGGEKKGAFTTKERRQRLLQFIVERNRAIQEAGTCTSGTELASCLAGSLDYSGILGQAEVIVRPDHDLLLAAADDMVAVALLDATEIRVESLSPGIRRIAVLSALLEEVSGHCYWLKKSQETEDV